MPDTRFMIDLILNTALTHETNQKQMGNIKVICIEEDDWLYPVRDWHLFSKMFISDYQHLNGYFMDYFLSVEQCVMDSVKFLKLERALETHMEYLS